MKTYKVSLPVPGSSRCVLRGSPDVSPGPASPQTFPETEDRREDKFLCSFWRKRWIEIFQDAQGSLRMLHTHVHTH